MHSRPRMKLIVSGSKYWIDLVLLNTIIEESIYSEVSSLNKKTLRSIKSQFLMKQNLQKDFLGLKSTID